jgi:small subunit ribosomal protein S3
MIERELIKEKLKEFQIQEYIAKRMSEADFSHAIIKKTPLGDKIIVYSAKPGMIVGRKGENIRDLTAELKARFDLENPQVEIAEIDNIYLDADVVAERIVSSLQRFGSMRFKQIGHKMMDLVMKSGALGIEIRMSGKIPSSRAKSWRFFQGYLKKSGTTELFGVRKAVKAANLKAGTIGVIVRIMPPDVKLPDRMKLIEEKAAVPEEAKAEEKKAEAEKPADQADSKSEAKAEEKTDAKEKKKRGRKKKDESEVKPSE